MSSPKSDEEAQTLPKSPDDDDDSESEPAPIESSPSESDSESDSDSDYEPLTYTRPDGTTRQLDPDDSDAENIPEVNIPRFTKILSSKRLRRQQEEAKVEYHEDLFDFQPDPENWREEDLKELWADAPIGMTKRTRTMLMRRRWMLSVRRLRPAATRPMRRSTCRIGSIIR